MQNARLHPPNHLCRIRVHPINHDALACVPLSRDLRRRLIAKQACRLSGRADRNQFLRIGDLQRETRELADDPAPGASFGAAPDQE